LSKYEDFAVRSSIKVAAMRRTHLLYIEANCSSARPPYPIYHCHTPLTSPSAYAPMGGQQEARTGGRTGDTTIVKILKSRLSCHGLSWLLFYKRLKCHASPFSVSYYISAYNDERYQKY